MGTLIALELEFSFSTQKSLMGLFRTIVGIQETLDLVLIRKVSKAARPAVLALLFSTQFFRRLGTVWTPGRVLGLGHIA